MKLNLISTKEILDLEQEIGYELEVNERPPHSNQPRFSVWFREGESMEGGGLISYSGKGNTIDEALKDYCKQVSCRKMAFNPTKKEIREEITFPKLIHTKMINQ